MKLDEKKTAKDVEDKIRKEEFSKGVEEAEDDTRKRQGGGEQILEQSWENGTVAEGREDKREQIKYS